jgi:hypothetical protein
MGLRRQQSIMRAWQAEESHLQGVQAVVCEAWQEMVQWSAGNSLCEHGGREINAGCGGVVYI